MQNNTDSPQNDVPNAASHLFKPLRYRPIPCFVHGLSENTVCLDGTWRFNPSCGPISFEQALNTTSWTGITIPGQWAQQGHDFPQDQTVALAVDFDIPHAWSDYRLFLRFDAVHAGTHYRLNAEHIGHSENLFTPVEFEITHVAVAGGRNRLYLEMTVDTVSERLAGACEYALHNVGGISRSVQVYALPATHVKTLRILTDLDADYRDATIDLSLSLDSRSQGQFGGCRLQVGLMDDSGNAVSVSPCDFAMQMLEEECQFEIAVANPRKWNAEKPCLYKLVLELVCDSIVLERFEHNIGFRKIEIKDRQIYINGVRVKWAGICRHEVDPLTGRADTMRHAEADVQLIKEANYNYIRTSHYPPTKELLDAADRLGVYVEVEAPITFVFKDPSGEMNDLSELLTPISAMVDYCHIHPSVVVWSLANESDNFQCFGEANELCKSMDPTRITTFNHSMHGTYEHVCDMANFHYVPMPYDELFKHDPRPLFLGEYFFPLCHEQTEMEINPGLRELWGMGHSDPESEWGKDCAKSFDAALLQPGAPPGFWNHICSSDQLVGGAVFAWIDELYFLPGGKRCGHGFHHGFWGMVDAWRRPKPEWWLSKLIFSPVWFPQRRVPISPGGTSVSIPVENRYSFTDLNELCFSWETGGSSGTCDVSAAPGETGTLDIPVNPDTEQGQTLVVNALDRNGTLVSTLSTQLGDQPPIHPPVPTSGCPAVSEDGAKVTIDADGFSLVFDRNSADFDVEDSEHTSSLAHFPTLHVTRQEFRDLAPAKPPYAELPDESTRVIEEVVLRTLPDRLEIMVRDRYDQFSGQVTLALDSSGVGYINYDYTYSAMGPSKTLPFVPLDCREIGVKIGLREGCQELSWRRWSEWGVFPEDSICRTEGKATTWRDASGDDTPKSARPTWPWSQDQTSLGTADFRSTKFNIYEATLTADDGSGVTVTANADRHVRACAAGDSMKMHILQECRLGPKVLRHRDRVAGDCNVRIIRPGSM